MKKYFVSAVTTFLLGVFLSVLFPGELQAKKERDTFFEKARFIMTKEEIDIYKHLEGDEDKQQFIREFWKKRDPDPTTDINENFEEFRSRIEYANKWFRETPKGEGWNTERGRILLQLGLPDRREFGDATLTNSRGQLMTSKRYPMERWYYYRYSLNLEFVDATDSGRLSLSYVPSNLLTTIELTKFGLDLREEYNLLKRSFRFDAKYKKGTLYINIPVKKLSFEDKDGKMSVDFNTNVYIYKNSKKIDHLNITKSYQWTKDELLQKKNIQYSINYPLKKKGKGKYYFDVVVEEVGSSSKFRDFVKVKQ